MSSRCSAARKRACSPGSRRTVRASPRASASRTCAAPARSWRGASPTTPTTSPTCVPRLSNGNADLGRIGLEHLFAVSLNARQLGAAKPARQCFERLAAELALPPGELLYVGDDAHLDVLAARAAGLKTAWMNRSGAPWPAQLPPADLTVRDCLELAQRL
jgi:hypothetical protein